MGWHNHNAKKALQPNICRVCQNTHCIVKGFLSLNPLAFTPVPQDMTAAKLIAETNVWKFSLAFV
jgi:hypothetical protein